MQQKKISSDKEYQFEFRKNCTSILALIPNMDFNKYYQYLLQSLII